MVSISRAASSPQPEYPDLTISPKTGLYSPQFTPPVLVKVEVHT